MRATCLTFQHTATRGPTARQRVPHSRGSGSCPWAAVLRTRRAAPCLPVSLLLAASGFFRGVLCLLMPLAITYLLELRMRRNWLLRRQVEAAQADAEVQQALRTQRQQERQDARRARSAGAEAGSELH